ncbi:apolipo protein O-domain-containing protein [Dipodascopsis tothii]|uniref:apolipo protein O-domain-containing protein n=1 Tax=Dipodascopsis tothii TaxID=44089 RepID=UPI0034CDAEC2
MYRMSSRITASSVYRLSQRRSQSSFVGPSNSGTLFGSFIAGTIGATVLLSTMSTVYAETDKKSIYDDATAGHTTDTPIVIKKPPTVIESSVRSARNWLIKEFELMDKHVDAALKEYFNIETKVTSTIASIHPTTEEILPGAIYVLVSALSGTIVFRKHNVLLRSFVAPVIFGGVAFRFLLPETFNNVAQLAWSYEKMVPEIANAHIKASTFITENIKGAELTTRELRQKVDETVASSRRAVKEHTGLLIESDEKKN